MSSIVGSHVVIHSKKPAIDRAFFRDILKLTNVDAGDGWLIFALPPSEVAFHPASENGQHEFYLLSDDVESFVKKMKNHNIECTAIIYLEWGMLTQLTLPGGGTIGVYQPRHARPEAGGPEKKSKSKTTPKPKSKKKPVKKKSAKARK